MHVDFSKNLTIERIRFLNNYDKIINKITKLTKQTQTQSNQIGKKKIQSNQNRVMSKTEKEALYKLFRICNLYLSLRLRRGKRKPCENKKLIKLFNFETNKFSIERLNDIACELKKELQTLKEFLEKKILKAKLFVKIGARKVTRPMSYASKNKGLVKDDDLITIIHGGGFLYISDFLKKKNFGYRLECPDGIPNAGIGLQVHPCYPNMSLKELKRFFSRSLSYARIRGQDNGFFDKSAVLIAQIKAKYLFSASLCTEEAGLGTENIKHLQNITILPLDFPLSKEFCISNEFFISNQKLFESANYYNFPNHFLFSDFFRNKLLSKMKKITKKVDQKFIDLNECNDFENSFGEDDSDGERKAKREDKANTLVSKKYCIAKKFNKFEVENKITKKSHESIPPSDWGYVLKNSEMLWIGVKPKFIIECCKDNVDKVVFPVLCEHKLLLLAGLSSKKIINYHTNSPESLVVLKKYIKLLKRPKVSDDLILKLYKNDKNDLYCLYKSITLLKMGAKTQEILDLNKKYSEFLLTLNKNATLLQNLRMKFKHISPVFNEIKENKELYEGYFACFTKYKSLMELWHVFFTPKEILNLYKKDYGKTLNILNEKLMVDKNHFYWHPDDIYEHLDKNYITQWTDQIINKVTAKVLHAKTV